MAVQLARNASDSEVTQWIVGWIMLHSNQFSIGTLVAFCLFNHFVFVPLSSLAPLLHSLPRGMRSTNSFVRNLLKPASIYYLSVHLAMEGPMRSSDFNLDRKLKTLSGDL
jgi:hypothetical protein